MYLVMARRELVDELALAREISRLVFVSCKNRVYTHSSGTFVCNLLLHHAYYESERTFDERQFGARYRHMRLLLFLLALINAELLRMGSRSSGNLALNMQSLGKAATTTWACTFFLRTAYSTCASCASRARPCAPTACWSTAAWAAFRAPASTPSACS